MIKNTPTKLPGRQKIKCVYLALMIGVLPGCMTGKFLDSSKEVFKKDPITEVIHLPYQAVGLVSNSLLDAATLNGSLLPAKKSVNKNSCSQDLKYCYTWWNVLN